MDEVDVYNYGQDNNVIMNEEDNYTCNNGLR